MEVEKNDVELDYEKAQGDSETPAESSPETTEGEDKTGEVEKTQQEEGSSEVSESPDDEEKDDGSPIPYSRFKKVNDTKKRYEQELDGLRKKVQSPKVLRAIMEEEGYTEDRIKSELERFGYQEEKKSDPEDSYLKELAYGLDLNSTDGWAKYQARIADYHAKRVEQNLQNRLARKEAEAWIKTQEGQAKELAEKSYNIKFGIIGKDEDNPNTAVGKIASYLSKYPEDAYLGHVKLLKLAMSEEGFKLGEQKGVQKEQDRLKKVKSAQMEGDNKAIGDDTPNESWSTSRLLEYARKNPKALEELGI